MYRLRFSELFLNKLKDMYIFIPPLILGWIYKNISMLRMSPRSIGKSLSPDNDAMWHYRFGAYRMLALVSDDKKVLLFIDILSSGEYYAL